jgi:hypothetical protein
MAAPHIVRLNVIGFVINTGKSPFFEYRTWDYVPARPPRPGYQCAARIRILGGDGTSVVQVRGHVLIQILKILGGLV